MISLDDVDDDDAPPLLSSVQLWLQGNKELQWKQQYAYRLCPNVRVLYLGFLYHYGRSVLLVLFCLAFILLDSTSSFHCNGMLLLVRVLRYFELSYSLLSTLGKNDDRALDHQIIYNSDYVRVVHADWSSFLPSLCVPSATDV